MKLSLICAIAGVGLSAAPRLAAQGLGVRAEVILEKSVVASGEPLVIVVTAQNATERKLMLPGDELVVDWTAKTEDGRTVCASERPHGDTMSLLRTVSPGGQFTFSVIAYETATIKRPGRYQLVVQYVPGFRNPSAAPSQIAFEVLPRDNSALAKRAQELHDKALDQSPGWEANARAGRAAEELASMDYAGSRPLLCDVLKRNAAAMGYALRRLERDPDAETVNCLVEYYRVAAPSMSREAVEWALKDILRDQRDPKLRARILAVAGAFAPEPCLQLASAEASALVSYLDGPEASQTAACIAFSVRQIGAKKYAAGVGTLIRYLGFRREPDFWERGDDVAASRHDWYPATAALSLIGKPALPPLVDLRGTETTPIVQAKALETLMAISGDDFVSAVKLLRAAAATQQDKAAESRLLDDAAKAAKMCPPNVRPQCEDAVR